jgi:hypothetical protein
VPYQRLLSKGHWVQASRSALPKKAPPQDILKRAMQPPSLESILLAVWYLKMACREGPFARLQARSEEPYAAVLGDRYIKSREEYEALYRQEQNQW